MSYSLSQFEQTVPDVRIGVFSLWVKSGSGSDSEDWLNVVDACDAPCATITTAGAILQLGDLERWLRQLRDRPAPRKNADGSIDLRGT